MRMLATMLFLVGCGGGGGSAAPDAAPDAPDVAVVRIDPCPAASSIDVMITAEATRFVPAMATMPKGGVVKYELATAHELVPFPDTDPALTVPAGSTRCFKITKPAVYRYYCKFDSFAGQITVQ